MYFSHNSYWFLKYHLNKSRKHSLITQGSQNKFSQREFSFPKYNCLKYFSVVINSTDFCTLT